MSTTYRYLLSTIVRHPATVGATYLALWLAVTIVAPQASNSAVVVAMLVLAPILLLLFFFRIRPVPQNPLQELALNSFILGYGGLVAVPTAYLFWAALHPSVAIFFAIVYAAILVVHCVDADHVVHHSPTGRTITYWKQEIRDHKARLRS